MYLYHFIDALGMHSWALSKAEDTVLLKDFDFDAWIAGSVGRVNEAISELAKIAITGEPTVLPPHLLPPIVSQDVWAAGVTYKRSREARQEEAQDGGDVYARVYNAQRPEIFFKAFPRYVVGHGGKIGIRGDSNWNVPEPELGVILNSAMDTVGFVIGNDMSSRDIEGENPLYLPQAKVYSAACSLGPCILLSDRSSLPETSIHLEIERDGKKLFSGETHTNRIQRTLQELTSYLGRSSSYPAGLVLLTGTGIVPPGEMSVIEGDVITIVIEGIGALSNTVKVV